MNYRFNIEEWLPRFPLKPEYEHFSGGQITSPCDICNNEQLRREASDQFDWGPAVPVDVFVMAEGEPPDRHVTKIGGLPYRPANLPWPRRQDGTPMSFLAQINFADSRDILATLPNDVLLIFAPDVDGFYDWLHFEWQPLGLTNLIPGDALPEQAWCPIPCHGHLYRTFSYPSGRIKPENEYPNYPKCRGLDIYAPYLLLQYQATQIGTVPYFIQQGDNQLPGRMLCAISSVGPDPHKPYPWINHPEPLMPEGEWPPWSDCEKYFMIGDTGCIYISIDEAGQLHSTESCY